MNNQLFVIAIVCLVISGMVKAESAKMEKETLHLLDYIGNSGCTFTRNGKEYQSEKARSHIQHKYKYVKKKVSTTEQVIEYAATKSSVTGKVYIIKCPGYDALPSAEWLARELLRFRSEQK